MWTFSRLCILTMYNDGPHGMCAVIPGHSAQAHMDSTNTEMRFTFYRRDRPHPGALNAEIAHVICDRASAPAPGMRPTRGWHCCVGTRYARGRAPPVTSEGPRRGRRRLSERRRQTSQRAISTRWRLRRPCGTTQRSRLSTSTCTPHYWYSWCRDLGPMVLHLSTKVLP